MDRIILFYLLGLENVNDAPFTRVENQLALARTKQCRPAVSSHRPRGRTILMTAGDSLWTAPKAPSKLSRGRDEYLRRS